MDLKFIFILVILPWECTAQDGDNSCVSTQVPLAQCAAQCPAGWDFVDGKCYKYFDAPATWNTANTTCTGLCPSGMCHLPRIYSEQQGEDLYNYAFSYSKPFPWIDVHKIATEIAGFYLENSDGCKYVNTFWAPGHPNGGLNIEICTHIFQNGLWGDADCDYDSYYVCETDKRLPATCSPPSTTTSPGPCSTCSSTPPSAAIGKKHCGQTTTKHSFSNVSTGEECRIQMKCADSNSIISINYDSSFDNHCFNTPSGAVFNCNAGTWRWTEGKLLRPILEVNCINLNGSPPSTTTSPACKSCSAATLELKSDPGYTLTAGNIVPDADGCNTMILTCSEFASVLRFFDADDKYLGLRNSGTENSTVATLTCGSSKKWEVSASNLKRYGGHVVVTPTKAECIGSDGKVILK